MTREGGTTIRDGGDMKSTGLTVFVLFFGIALLDALRGGEWPRVIFWLAIGAGFWALERHPLRRRR